MTLYSKYIIIFLFIAHSLYASTTYKIEKVADGFGIPWGMTFLNDSELLITQKSGEILLYNINTKKTYEISHEFEILHKGQGGLLDIQKGPNYIKDKWVYITYVKDANGGTTTLIRAKIINKRLSQVEELLETKSGTGTGYHFGSRITFDENGHVYFSIGDRGERPNGQDNTNHASTIIRLNLDGSVPKDNPFMYKNGLDEIYSYGHRNPQGLFYDKNSKMVFSIEHGPRGGDEINIIKSGANYGWPIISYGKEYWNNNMVGESTYKKGMEQPIKQFTPSIAPSSLIVYSGKLFKEWKGNIFSGALKLRHLNRIVLNGTTVIEEERMLKNLNERIRNVIESPSGEIFIATDNGNIYKITK
jgi:glucose/arabinose dehydrogenase